MKALCSCAVGAAMLLAGNVGWAGIITKTNSTTGLFDASSDTRTVSISVADPGFGSGTIIDVNIAINFAKADGEAFNPPFPSGTPFHNEIVFKLTSPGGTEIDLIIEDSFNSGSALFDGTITFDDSAAQVVNVNPNTPQAGTFRPIEALAGLNGEQANGTWTLFIQDTVGADALRFRSFDLIVTTPGGEPVPEPASLCLWGLAVGGGLAASARRRRAS